MTSTWNRRHWLQMMTASLCGATASGWLPELAAGAGESRPHRSCILLWMTGGPSQIDTFDMKPDHDNGGPFKPIDTSVPGIQVCEHLPKMAKVMDDLAVIRSMSTKEGDHARATYLMRTGYLPQGPVHYPTLGSLLSKELGGETELPNYISISPYQFLSPAAFSPGFLGPQHAPLVVGNSNNPYVQANADYAQALQVKNLSSPKNVKRPRQDARLGLLDEMEREFHATRGGAVVDSHQAAYRQAVKMMRSETVKAFDVKNEPKKLREAYGNSPFGQGCLLARRLVERGVPFVELSLSAVPGQQVFGWDTHQNNFNSVQALCGVLDPAWSTLIQDLRDRGLLDSTLIVWMGEFGRTPKINGIKGRDHFPAAWTTVLAGGGVRGGQVHGATDKAGMTVSDKPVSVGDLVSTICHAVGLDPKKQNMSNVGRPIRLADPDAKPLKELLS